MKVTFEGRDYELGHDGETLLCDGATVQWDHRSPWQRVILSGIQLLLVGMSMEDRRDIRIELVS